MSDKSMINDLTQGSVGRQLVKYSLPFLLANALQSLYALVDMVTIGHFVGTSGLTAVSCTSQFVWILTCIGMGFSNAGQIIIAQLAGARDHEGISRTIGTMFTTIILLSFIIGGIGLAISRPFVGWINTPPDAVEQAYQYTVISCCGAPFIYGYNMVSATLRGMGESRKPLIFVLIATIVNIVLDLLFVGVFHMKADGAAYATVIGQAVSFICSVVYLYRRRESFGFDFKAKSFKPDSHKLKALLRLGAPMALENSAINFSMMVVTAFVNVYGTVASATLGIGGKLNSLMFVITGSMRTAGASMTGQMLGAGKQDKIPKIFRANLLICMSACVLFGGLVMLFPKAFFGLFTPDPEVLEMARDYSKVVAVFFLTFATMTPATSLIMGIGYGSMTFLIAMMDGVVGRIVLSVLMGKVMGMGLYGYFWGNCLAGFISTILGNAYYFSGRWKNRKRIV